MRFDLINSICFLLNVLFLCSRPCSLCLFYFFMQVFARIIKPNPEGRAYACDIALDNINEIYLLDVPNVKIGKLNARICEACLEGCTNTHLIASALLSG